MGGFTFLSPWVLIGLLALPVLWWILRVTPPPERRYIFPPVRIFSDSLVGQPSPTSAPPWLIVLRLLCAGLALLGLAQPTLTAPPSATSSLPLLVVVDNGWSTAANWDQSFKNITALLKKAETHARTVQIVSTARSSETQQLDVSTPGPAANAEALLKKLEPYPWSSDLAALADLLTTNPKHLPVVQKSTETIWVTDGLEKPYQDTVLTLLKERGPVTIIPPPPEALPPVILLPIQQTDTGLQITVRRPTGSSFPPLELLIRAIDHNETVHIVHPITMERDTEESSIVLPVNTEDKPLISRVELTSLSGQPLGAGAVQLMDDRWRQLPVGIVRRSGDSHLPLLSGPWYVERALSESVATHTGPLEHLLTRRLSMIVVSGGQIPSSVSGTLSQWIQDGGILVRFADDELAQQGHDTLLPVRLRHGKRTLGGGLSWQPPLSIRKFRDNSPLAHLPIPPDVTISAQMLAEPGPQTDQHTWAWLQDGTPLVTAQRTGKGWIIFIHTSANTEWGTLPLSGLFPALLTRFSQLTLGPDNNPVLSDDLLFPWKVLDGKGRIITPGPHVKPLAASQLVPTTKKPTVTPQHPPGWYGPLGKRHTLAVARSTTHLHVTQSYGPDITVQTTHTTGHHINLGPALLTASVVVLLIDGLVMCFMMGVFSALFKVWRTATAKPPGILSSFSSGLILTSIILLSGAITHTAWTAPNALVDDALDSRLAWIATGDQAVDAITESGLKRLTGDLALRTAVEFSSPRRIDPKHDPIEFYPLVYWPVTRHTPHPDRETHERIALYLDKGGMIIFDGRHPDNTTALQTFLTSLNLPPLQPLPRNHVLTRSFYLLPGLPGRFSTNPNVWIAHSPHSENVSPIIASSVDWVGAWATDAQGHPLLPMIPPTETQREMTVRSGINMVMYALTGTYKADQVHIPAILERLTQ